MSKSLTPERIAIEWMLNELHEHAPDFWVKAVCVTNMVINRGASLEEALTDFELGEKDANPPPVQRGGK